MNAVIVMDAALSNYMAPGAERSRYAEMLVNRAVKKYIDSGLDAPTVEEDLFQEESDLPDKYPNIDYSIAEDEKFAQGIVAFRDRQDRDWIKREVKS
jgi:hypothetical protein